MARRNHLAGGFFWGGLNLCSVNYVYDATAESDRAGLLAYFNVLNGSAIGLGVLAGGFLLKFYSGVFVQPFTALFVTSGFLRILAAAGFRRAVPDQRTTEPAVIREVMYDLAGQRVVPSVLTPGEVEASRLAGPLMGFATVVLELGGDWIGGIVEATDGVTT